MRRQHWIVSEQARDGDDRRDASARRIDDAVARERRHREPSVSCVSASHGSAHHAATSGTNTSHIARSAARSGTTPDVAVLPAARAHDHRADAQPVRGDRERDDEQREVAHGADATAAR